MLRSILQGAAACLQQDADGSLCVAYVVGLRWGEMCPVAIVLA